MSGPAMKLLVAARLLLATRSMPEEKMLVLLAKIRKGAYAFKGSVLEQVLHYLGGWKFREIPQWAPQGMTPGNEERDEIPATIADADKARVEALHEKKLSEQVTELPDPTTRDLGTTVTMDVGPIKEDKFANKKYFFDLREWKLANGLEITSPDGQVFRSYDDLKTFRRTSPGLFDSVDSAYPRRHPNFMQWLRQDTKFLQQVSDKLGLTTIDEEKRQRSIPTKENTATCPCCFRVQKLMPKSKHGSDLSRPGMVIHGYKRPGVGHIFDNCFGQFWPPFELSKEGTEAFLDRVHSTLEEQNDYLKRLNADQIVSLLDSKGRKVLKSEATDYDWKRVTGLERDRTQSYIRTLGEMSQQLQNAIKDWAPKPLPNGPRKTTEV